MVEAMCTNQVQTPFEIIYDLSNTHPTLTSLVAILIAGSYIQQFILTATHDPRGNGAISGWYIILLTVSASSHFAARIGHCYSYWAYKCVRAGELKRYEAFSALLVFIQPLVHWVVYRTRDDPVTITSPDPAIIKTALLTTTEPTRSPSMTEYPITSPSNQVILAVTLSHAAITLPISIALLVHFEENLVTALANQVYGHLLVATGTLTSLTACIPQVYLMATTTRLSLQNAEQEQAQEVGSLSTLTLGLQVLGCLALAGSQGRRMKWCTWTLFFGGPVAGWLALAVSQLVVLGFALRGGGREGRIQL
ncbi:hypothetical protein BJX66DRAFT_347591 [Aspergillus keveii]|uniref:Uncharacterized protein n=1 Tax=Aspergillus keveii TaxID=714993 RepID=A0ABR4FQ02_9EURO